MGVMIDLYCASYAKPPDAVTLDIDDTVDVVHGHQQLSLFNAHYDERRFLPIHVYDAATSRPVAVLLRPGKTPSGVEVRGHLRRLVRRIRRHWPQTQITIRGDGHYGRSEVMEWCDENGVDFIFGLPGNAVLDRTVDEIADDIRTRRALDQKPCLRGFAETSYRAKSWKTDRRACARIDGATVAPVTRPSNLQRLPQRDQSQRRNRRLDYPRRRHADVAVRLPPGTAANKSG
jgi:Transposase DDE domain group 1